ncbi:MAG: class I SAM-dependent methyltransferase [candidate division NC10 bacterium]|nr:class I SAM-dependent methyltransferase [candidate division NC10 bacterium]
MLTIYQVPALYRLLMRLGYGPDYAARYALVAARIGEPDDLLEVCCGHLGLYRHLARRGLVRSYVGLEQAPAMVRLARRRGIDVRAVDVRAGGALPAAATVIMQASLYQFHDIADTLLPRLWAAARRRLVIAEPVRNLSQSRFAVVRWAARALTRTPDGRIHTFRYTEATLLDCYRRCGVPVSRVDRTPGGHEVVISSLRAPSP